MSINDNNFNFVLDGVDNETTLRNFSKSGIIEYDETAEDLNNKESDKKSNKEYDIPVINFTIQEKIRCLEEIEIRLKKILHVYDESLKPNSNYNYKVYIGGVLIYISSSNMLFGGELVNVIVNLNAILANNFAKPQIKRIIFESRNYVQYLLSNYRKEYDSRDIEDIDDL